jgi:phage terminase small subunit
MSKKLKTKGLTAKQFLFCQEYIKDLNGSRAATAAGFKEHSASAAASRMLDWPHIQEHIQMLMDKRANKMGIDADRVLKSILAIAEFDIGDLYTPEGVLKPVHQMPKEVRQILSGVKVGEIKVDGERVGEMVEPKIPDRLKALELLGRHLKLFTDKIEHSGDITIADRMAKARERVKAGKKD